VAEYFKKTLGLPPDAITYDGWATRSRSPRTTRRGTALNRRVEVDVWYDEVRKATGKRRSWSRTRPSGSSLPDGDRVQAAYKEARRTGASRTSSCAAYEDTPRDLRRFIQQIRQSLDNLHDKQN